MNFLKIKKILIWTAIFILTAATLIYSNNENINLDNYERGDYAANSLLIIDAKSFDLLTGNYSRVGFNHPGPAILYVLAAGEKLFFDFWGLVSNPFSGQLIAVAFYNALWICLLASLLLSIYQSVNSALLSLSAFLFVTSLLWEPFFLSIWFPHLYFLPFSVFLIACARLAQGEADSLGVLALSSGVLFNGHVAFVPILGLILILSISWNFKFYRNEKEFFIISSYFLKKNKASVLFACTTFIFLLLPFILMTIKYFPGPSADYINFAAGRPANSIWQSLKYVSVYWGGIAPMVVGVAICVVFLNCNTNKSETLIGAKTVSWVLISATVAIISYAKFGIDKLDEPYMGFFYYSVPALLAGIIFPYFLQPSLLKFVRWITLFFSLMLLLGCFRNINSRLTDQLNYRQPYLRDIYNSINAINSDGRIILNLDRNNDWDYVWASILGVKIIEKRSNINLFCINRNWHISFTKPALCTDFELASSERFFVSKYSNKNIEKGNFQAGGLLFEKVTDPILRSGANIMVSNNQDLFMNKILTSGWSEAEPDFVWSEGRIARLKFSTKRKGGPGLIKFDVAAFLPHIESTQELRISLNDGYELKAKFSNLKNRQIISVPFDTRSRNLDFVFTIESPISPKAAGISSDYRVLGVALYGVAISRDLRD
jgi:hypothetical protein